MILLQKYRILITIRQKQTEVCVLHILLLFQIVDKTANSPKIRVYNGG